MNQEKVGQFIKKLRKENNLTQAELANKYGVTYQAVSKWENGKNLPDVSLLKQMSKDFNIEINDLLEGKIIAKNTKSKKNFYIVIIIVLFLLALVLLDIFLFHKDDSFEFKKLASNCSNFTISGSIAYNNNKSSIYISNVNYCGGDDDTKYQYIECVLYESNNNTDTKIDTFIYDKDSPIKLEKFLQNVRFNIDNYAQTCNLYKQNGLFLQINAHDYNDKITSYKIPLKLEENCS